MRRLVVLWLFAGCAMAGPDSPPHPKDLAAPPPANDLSTSDGAVPDLRASPDLLPATPGDGAAPADLAGGGDLATLPATTVLVSQIRSRGAGGASDEFVELYNPTAASVTLDSTWVVEGRSSAAASFTARWTGAGQVLPAHKHLLLGGSAYAQTPAADAALTGITDAGALRLSHNGAIVDAVCYSFDATTQAALTGDATYGCPGTPADNTPHNNGSSAASNADVSIERKPGGAGGNGTQTGSSAADFSKTTPAVPRDLASNPAP